ncbi:HAMP domain-containing sensor histidine kinase [Vibrio sp. SCSIO 43136]|uniref:sensor histidine kinase n=1 Tax=Vibrio sp. SCSIO 43136 TaxID=2819101 RepID=UPI00207547DA|nr:HAMP domain-containing sensor histidine kinase [Vibrio sp. SCSIO 43136]USD67557.1 HAMP domain-containing histidine kinase [Vibrio sp. SCSIO 43136]
MMFGIEKRKHSNSIHDVKVRLLKHFSIIALLSSFLVFMAFSVRLIVQEDEQIERHLQSFEQVAVTHYKLSQQPYAVLSQYVTAYYDRSLMPELYLEQLPVPVGSVSRFRDPFEAGYMIYHNQFEWNGETISYYLTIDGTAVEFGDDNWDTLLMTSSLLMVFLLVILRFALKRVFDQLMAPMTELSNQLSSDKTGDFAVSETAIDELKQLTNKLNSYSEMKERVAKQELMFAKYASHELKTPIAIISGAANLQAMSDEPQFQAKQRQRIVDAADGMQQTVEVLLNIVKQENAAHKDKLHVLKRDEVLLADFEQKAAKGVSVILHMDAQVSLNMPPVVASIIINNLVENALRFTVEGEVTISVSESEIGVVDSGRGLSKQPETEHGLGLLIVSRIAKSYGWAFEIRNRGSQTGCVAILNYLDSSL